MTVFLLLGDGDFSYSVDLAQYLSTSSSNNESCHTLIATGVDTHDEVMEKYKDSNHLLHQLVAYGGISGAATTTGVPLNVEIHHGINAVMPTASNISPANVVIFNHPHLGTEDAARHGRFLQHFLHACKHEWLNKSATTATVHLTLAIGQWERWNGPAAADRHGFILHKRMPFLPPPCCFPKYQHRRHQTGKSFRNRTLGSETFVLVPQEFQHQHGFLFDWQQQQRPELTKINAVEAGETAATNNLFACALCERTFREERSLKSHVAAVHKDDNNNNKNKRKRKLLECEHCDRSFNSEESLQDHVRAKHTGQHSEILPEWAAKQAVLDTVTNESTAETKCEICSHDLVGDDTTSHMNEFVPSARERTLLNCHFCSKAFRDERARQQHENFCRNTSSGNVVIGK